MSVKYSTDRDTETCSKPVCCWYDCPQAIFCCIFAENYEHVPVWKKKQKTDEKPLIINDIILTSGYTLFLLENIFKGNWNHLNSCVGSKQKHGVCDCGDVCAHLGQMHSTLRTHARQSLCASEQNFSGLSFGIFWPLYARHKIANAPDTPSLSCLQPTGTQMWRRWICYLLHIGVRCVNALCWAEHRALKVI